MFQLSYQKQGNEFHLLRHKNKLLSFKKKKRKNKDKNPLLFHLCFLRKKKKAVILVLCYSFGNMHSVPVSLLIIKKQSFSLIFQ